MNERLFLKCLLKNLEVGRGATADGELDSVEAMVLLEQLTEDLGDDLRWVLEGATTPGTKDEDLDPLFGSDIEHLLEA